MSDAEEPCCSRRLQQLELEVGLLHPLAAAAPTEALPLTVPLPPAVRALALPPWSSRSCPFAAPLPPSGTSMLLPWMLMKAF
jgi:hypothetical protein